MTGSGGLRMIRTRVDADTFSALSDEALRAGVTLAEYVRSILMHSSGTEPLAVSVPARSPVDPARLARAVLWMQSQGLVKPATITTKSGLMAWCEQQGFEQ